MRKLSVILLIFMVTIMGCGLKDDAGNSSSTLPGSDTLITKDEVTDGDFVYRLVTEKSEYQKNEPVKIYAELEYIGDMQEITIYHAASPFYFPMVEKTRDLTIDYAMNEPLISTTLVKGEILREEYKGSGGFSSEDDREYINFMKKIIKNQFPIGHYVVDGFADFFMKNGENENQNYKIKGQVEFKVVNRTLSQ